MCVCVAAQSRGRVGLWQLSLRRGCADQGWAENQGLAVLKRELHDSSPTWEPYLLAAASPIAPSPWSPQAGRGYMSVWLTPDCLSALPTDSMSVWLCPWLPVWLTYPIAWLPTLHTNCLSLTYSLCTLYILPVSDVILQSWEKPTEFSVHQSKMVILRSHWEARWQDKFQCTQEMFPKPVHTCSTFKLNTAWADCNLLHGVLLDMLLMMHHVSNTVDVRPVGLSVHCSCQCSLSLRVCW